MKFKIGFAASIFLFVMLSLLISGCAQPTDTNEAKKWFEQEYGQKVLMSKNYFEREDDEGYTERVWTAYLKDYPDIKFEIVSDPSSGLFGIDYNLKTDFDYQFGKYYFEEYKKLHDECELEIGNRDYTYNGVVLSGYYEDRSQIEPVCKMFEAFDEYLDDQPIAIYAQYGLGYKNILLDAKGDNDTIATIDADSSIDKLKSDALYEYTLYCIQYQINLDEFTPEEIEEVVSQQRENDKFVLTLPDGESVQYNDLMKRRFGYGLTYGTVYEVLRRNEYPTLKGDASHYSFIGADGSKYEISYDFNDALYAADDVEYEGYYYLKDGEQVLMDYYWYNFFASYKLEEMTGYSFEKLKAED